MSPHPSLSFAVVPISSRNRFSNSSRPHTVPRSSTRTHTPNKYVGLDKGPLFYYFSLVHRHLQDEEAFPSARRLRPWRGVGPALLLRLWQGGIPHSGWENIQEPLRDAAQVMTTGLGAPSPFLLSLQAWSRLLSVGKMFSFISTTKIALWLPNWLNVFEISKSLIGSPLQVIIIFLAVNISKLVITRLKDKEYIRVLDMAIMNIFCTLCAWKDGVETFINNYNRKRRSGLLDKWPKCLKIILECKFFSMFKFFCLTIGCRSTLWSLHFRQKPLLFSVVRTMR